MKISKLFRFLLVLEILMLLIYTNINSIDYQDNWILQNIEIPFIIFIITYITFFFMEDKVSYILFFSVVVRFFLLLIPNLKYYWFHGTAFDQHVHYNIFMYLNKNFLIEDIPFFGRIFYVPLLHLYLSICSKITSISHIFSYKFFTIIFWLPYPLLIYLILKNSSFKHKNIYKYSL
ncbi:MAG: hypothetical protein ACFFDN_25865, partial [Candidatus Hodarchaeota archaeon]